MEYIIYTNIVSIHNKIHQNGRTKENGVRTSSIQPRYRVDKNECKGD